MKFTKDALQQLAEPDTGTLAYEMTPERKKKFSRVAGEVVDLLRGRTEGPLEGFAILQFVLMAMQDAYGIRGGIVMENSDQAH